MNLPPRKSTLPVTGAHDDPSIPVLTDRLGLPPLDFDTTLPLIDTSFPLGEATLQPQHGSDPLDIPTAPLLPLPPLTTSAAPPAPPARPAPSAARTAAPPAPATHTTGEGGHWARIEIDLRTAILREITAQLPREVDQVVRERMAPALEQLLSALGAEVQRTVAASLQRLVESAVRAELERLRNSNRG